MVFARISRIIIVIVAVLIFMEWQGYSITGVLALGGVGGLAISFAAKDLLANFFGGIMIFLDRPFAVGDWIRSPDRNIEGVVEKIGWRTTAVRTFDHRPIYIPNSIFTQIVVENPSRMSGRRINETIGVRHEDLDKISLIVKDIKTMLMQHINIDSKQEILVSFNRFSGFSLDILIDVYTTTTNEIVFYKLKEEILLGVSEILKTHGAEIAFPSSTVYLHKE